MGSEGRKRSYKRSMVDGRGPAVPKNSQGFLVTCEPGYETVATREALDVITVSYEELTASSEELVDKDEAADMSELLAAEVEGLKKRKDCVFVPHATQAKGVLFIGCGEGYCGPSPVTIVRHILAGAVKTGVSRTRRCIKFLPVTHSSSANMESVVKMAKLIAPEVGKSDGESDAVSFAVEMDRRSIPGLDRLKVINAFATAVPQPPHSVNLTSPRKVIIVQVVRNSCTVAVMDGEVFRQVKKCNIRMCCEEATKLEKGKACGHEASDDGQPVAPGDQSRKEEGEVCERSVENPSTDPCLDEMGVGLKRKRDQEVSEDGESDAENETRQKQLSPKSVHPG